jgi:hypothetical protein
MALLLANFPPLTGRYHVGSHDIEWENKKTAEATTPPDKHCKSVLMRLYYPANIKKGDSKANWITHAEYAKGKTKYIYIYIYIYII